VGKDGIKVNEIACRLGGAYEDEFIPLLTEVDILDLSIDSSLGTSVNYTNLRNYSLAHNNKLMSIQLLFANPGKIKTLGSMEEIKQLPGVYQAKFNFKAGDEIAQITNATQRIGYAIVLGTTLEELKENIARVFDNLKILDPMDNNLIIKF
jgi:biotin carboxylase